VTLSFTPDARVAEFGKTASEFCSEQSSGHIETTVISPPPRLCEFQDDEDKLTLGSRFIRVTLRQAKNGGH